MDGTLTEAVLKLVIIPLYLDIAQWNLNRSCIEIEEPFPCGRSSINGTLTEAVFVNVNIKMYEKWKIKMYIFLQKSAIHLPLKHVLFIPQTEGGSLD